jgi:integrase
VDVVPSPSILSVTPSSEDNALKTKRSQRTIPLRPEVVAVLRGRYPLRVAEDLFVFTTEMGTALNEERFVEKHWRPALRALDIRPRKFYATRHTFITQTLLAGAVSIKKLADYCGTSVEMIEKHYADWMEPETAAELAALGGTACCPAAASGGVVIASSMDQAPRNCLKA